MIDFLKASAARLFNLATTIQPIALALGIGYDLQPVIDYFQNNPLFALALQLLGNQGTDYFSHSDDNSLSQNDIEKSLDQAINSHDQGLNHQSSRLDAINSAITDLNQRS